MRRNWVGVVCWSCVGMSLLLTEARPTAFGDQRGSSASRIERQDEDSLALRILAARPVVWEQPGPLRGPTASIRILAVNDFHGHLMAGHRADSRPVGGAAVLAAYLQAAQHDSASGQSTFIVHAGDHVGASAPESALLQDEPSITFFNMLGNRHCDPNDRLNPDCNLVGTPGNHEFDEGKEELLRLIQGGNHPAGPFLADPYPGASFPYVSANVVDQTTRQPILPPFVIKQANGVRVAFIGAVLKETPTIVTPTGVAGLAFLDEAESINRYVRQLRAHDDVRAFVVLIHQGGRQVAYEGPTQKDAQAEGQAITDIVARLDDDVDLVVSGHSHSFTNALVKNRHGKDILVAQAFSFGTAYGDIHMAIDRHTGDVVSKSAAIVTVFGDAGPGAKPDPATARMVAEAEAMVAPLVRRVIGTSAMPIPRAENEAGESPLGNLIADAQRRALHTDFAFMNPGGIRTDLPSGSVTYHDLFTVQPFGNTLIRLQLTGQQIYDLLNQQWLNQPQPRMLQVSGLTYRWDSHRPIDDRVVEVRQHGVPIGRATVYSVTVNDFLAAGGDNFSVLTQGRIGEGGPIDLKALIAHIQSLPQPFTVSTDRRITRTN